MKIMYVLNSSQPGGMEYHVRDLANGMVSKGHEVYVWSPNGPLVPKFVNHSARKIKFDIDLGYIFSLFRFLKKHKIDIIHAHEPKSATNAMLSGFLARTKVRVAHTHTPISKWKVNPIKRKLNILIYTLLVNLFVTKEIALTESIKKIKIKEGIRKNKLIVVEPGNAVDVKRFTKDYPDALERMAEIYNFPKDKFIFGCIGRLSEEKGHFILLNAYKKIVSKDNHLLIAGGGPLEKEIREKVVAFGLENKVTVTGRFVDEDLVPIYKSIDCFIHPTLAEGWGIVFIEAMLAKIPVIASDLEVLKEVGGDNAVYFETGNSYALAKKMFLVNNDKVASAYIWASSRYTLDKFVNSYEGLYFSLLE